VTAVSILARELVAGDELLPLDIYGVLLRAEPLQQHIRIQLADGQWRSLPREQEVRVLADCPTLAKCPHKSCAASTCDCPTCDCRACAYRARIARGER
jgi:hypothetical protein